MFSSRQFSHIMALALISILVLFGCTEEITDPDPGAPAIASIAGEYVFASQVFQDVEVDTHKLEFSAEDSRIDEVMIIDSDGHYSLDGSQTISLFDSTIGLYDSTIFYAESGTMGIHDGTMIIIPEDPDESRFAFDDFTYYRYEDRGDILSIQFFFAFRFDFDFDGVLDSTRIELNYQLR